MSKKLQRTYLDVDGHPLPIKIYHEYRKDVRASIGKKAAILRIPLYVNKEEQQKHFAWFEDWVREKFTTDRRLFDNFFGKGYEDGDQLKVGDRVYQLHIRYTDNKSHNARLKNGILYLQLSKSDNPAHLQKSIKHLLSRVIAQDYKPEIIRRVNELNNIHFRQAIKSVNLKYNHTNWGSCSSKGNVNLSTRLLFAPESVVDYVIIHELAHLIELNHSERFWKLVSDAMPDYKKAEVWLKENDHLCNF